MKVSRSRRPRPATAVPTLPPIKLVLLHSNRDPDGELRHGLLLPGCPIPIAFASATLALAAKRQMEARR